MKKNKLANVLIISDENSLKNINKSARNIRNLKLIKDEGANIYDLFKYKNVIFTSTSVKKIQERILNENESLFGIDKLNIKRSIVPAITHIDYSARIQTVHKQTNPVYHSLITKFYELTNCPMVVNTSFNVRGEPIVCTPEDAFNCFMGTELDVLVINNFLMIKSKQDPQLIKSYEKEYELD